MSGMLEFCFNILTVMFAVPWKTYNDDVDDNSIPGRKI